jgi:catechol 2,3-dioxygenase-like lactoylglutathione lyase family enzyme
MPLQPSAALLTLASPQFDHLVQFYRQFLSLEPVTLLPNSYAEFHLPGLRLGIFRPKDREEVDGGWGIGDSENPFPSSPTGMALCLEVPNLEEAITHLATLGYPPSSDIIAASHGCEVYAADPDGNWLILHQT